MAGAARARARSRRATLPGHLVRGLAGVSAVACYFYAIARLRLADAVLLNQSMPLFIPLVERGWLGERVPPRLWAVLLLGFGGLLFILGPAPASSSRPHWSAWPRRRSPRSHRSASAA